MEEKVCPVWVGYLLASPIRKLFQNPDKILSPYIEEGNTAIDIGCAMGFFSLPLAKMVGPHGNVICVDIQEKMLSKLRKRAKKAGLSKRIETRVCDNKTLGISDLKESVDFVLAFSVVHEVSNIQDFFSEINYSLKQNGKLLISEPSGHVTKEGFEKSMEIALQKGFEIVEKSKISKSYSVLLKKLNL